MWGNCKEKTLGADPLLLKLRRMCLDFWYLDLVKYCGNMLQAVN